MSNTQKPYWHELTPEQVEQLIQDKKTWGYIVENYQQPSWCEYEQALNGLMGCWSLTDFEIRKNISHSFCKDCPCYGND